MRTYEVKQLLRERHKPPAWAYLEEVGNTTGYNVSRFADALAMSLYPSRGLDLHGFEVKVSRSDWVKELNSPEKAETICAYCDFWWIVAGSADIVKEGELPRTWGLLVVNDKGVLTVKQKAPKLEAKPMTKGLLAAILRRTCETLTPEARAKELMDIARKEGREEGRKFGEEQVKYKQSELDRLQEKVRTFEQASGVQLGSFWNGENIGRAVRAVLEGERNQPEERLRDVRRAAENVIKLCDKALEPEVLEKAA